MDRIFVVGGTGQHIIGSLFHLKVLLERFTDKNIEPEYEIILLDMDKGSDDEKKGSANSEVKSYKEYYEVQEDIKPIPRHCENKYGKFKELNSLLGIKAEYLPLFFDDDQLNVEIKKGMFGQSAVGSILFEEKFRFEEDKNDIIKIMKPNQTGGSKSNNIFVIGSCVGGTGSGVMPELIRRIAKDNNQSNIYAIPFMRWFKLIESGGNKENQRKADNRNNLMKANEQTGLVVYRKLVEEFKNLKVIPVGFDDKSLDHRTREWSGDFAQPAYFDWVHLNVAEIIRRISMGFENVNNKFLALVANQDGSVGDFYVFVDEKSVFKLSDLILANIKLINYSNTLDKVKEILGRRISFFGKPKEVEYLDELKIDKILIEKKKKVLLKLKSYKGHVCFNLEDLLKRQIDEQNTKEIQKLWEEFFKYCEKSESKHINKYIQSIFMRSAEPLPINATLFVPSPHDSEIKPANGAIGRLVNIEANLLDKLADISWTLPNARAERRALPNWYSDVLKDEEIMKDITENFINIYKSIGNMNFDDTILENQTRKRILYWLLLIVDHLVGKCFIDSSDNLIESNAFLRRNWKINGEDIKVVYAIKNEKNELLGYTDPAVFFVPSSKYFSIKDKEIRESVEHSRGVETYYRRIVLAIAFLRKVFIDRSGVNEIFSSWIREEVQNNPPPWYFALKSICYTKIDSDLLGNTEKETIEKEKQILPIRSELINFPLLTGKGKIEDRFSWFGKFKFEDNKSKIDDFNDELVLGFENIIGRLHPDRKNLIVSEDKGFKEIDDLDLRNKIESIIKNRVKYEKIVDNVKKEFNIILTEELTSNNLYFARDDKGVYLSLAEYKVYLNLPNLEICSVKSIEQKLFSNKILGYYDESGRHRFLTIGFIPEFLPSLEDIKVNENETTEILVSAKVKFLKDEIKRKYDLNRDSDFAPGYEKQGDKKIPVVMSIYPDFYYKGFKNYYFRYYVSDEFKEIDKYKIRLIIEIKEKLEEKGQLVFSDYINLREADNISIYEIIEKHNKDLKRKSENCYYLPRYVEFVKFKEDGSKINYGVRQLKLADKELETRNYTISMAIDFGTSNTMVGIKRDNLFFTIGRNAEKIILQKDEGVVDAASNSLWILPYYEDEVKVLPSVLAIDKKNSDRVGLVNYLYRNDEKFVYAREFKLNDANLLLRDGVFDFAKWGLTLTQCKVRYLTLIIENLLINYISYDKCAFEKIIEVKASMPDRLMIGNGAKEYKEVLKQVFDKIQCKFNIPIESEDSIHIVQESHISLDGEENNQVLVLADLGGGTFDLSIRYYVNHGYDEDLLFFDSFHMGGEFFLNLIGKYGKEYIPAKIRKEKKDEELKELLIEFIRSEKSLYESLYKDYKDTEEEKRYKKLSNLYFISIIEYLCIQIYGFILKVIDKYRYKEKDIENIKIRLFLSGKGWLLYNKSLDDEIKTLLVRKLQSISKLYGEKIKLSSKDKHEDKIAITRDYIIEGKEKLVKSLLNISLHQYRHAEDLKDHGFLGVELIDRKENKRYVKESYLPIDLFEVKDDWINEFTKRYYVNTEDIFNYEYFERIVDTCKLDKHDAKANCNKLFEKQLKQNNPFLIKHEDVDRSLARIVSSPIIYVYEEFIKDVIEEKLQDRTLINIS